MWLALVSPPGSSATVALARELGDLVEDLVERRAERHAGIIYEMDRARVVVIGGGIAGCSVAYHLAKAGWREIVLLEKAELTSGSTHHAAGLVTQFNPSSTMMRFRRYSVELYRELDVFADVGSVRIASSEDSLLDLRRAVSAAAGIGLEAELISPREVLEPPPGGRRRADPRRRLDGRATGTSTRTSPPTRWRTRRGRSASTSGCGRA